MQPDLPVIPRFQPTATPASVRSCSPFSSHAHKYNTLRHSDPRISNARLLSRLYCLVLHHVALYRGLPVFACKAGRRICVPRNTLRSR
eukprot:9130662-Pyramimonas_sp.AAC.1